MLARRYSVLPTVIRDLSHEDLGFVKLCRDAGRQAEEDGLRANPDAMVFPVVLVGSMW
jgi:hypothetical protein